VSGGNHRWFKRSTGKKSPVTRDDDDDDDDDNNNSNNNTLNGVSTAIFTGVLITGQGRKDANISRRMA